MTEFRFEPGTTQVLRAPHGRIVFVVVNRGTVLHDMTILDAAGSRLAQSEEVAPGDSSLLTVRDLPAGTYRIVCSQPGHVEAGMVGSLVVS